MSIFHDGILEHTYPAFFKAMSNSDHVGITLSISMAGYVLGGSSYFQAFLFGSAWAILIYYSCHGIYDGYMMGRQNTDMADIQACYLQNPDNGFWVAEVEINGQAKVVGMVAVMGKRGEEEGVRSEDWNGTVSTEMDAGNRSYGLMSHVVVKFPWRRKNLGSQLTLKALDFCKGRGFSHLTVDVSTPQTAAISMFQKLGFVQKASHHNMYVNWWFSKLARINVVQMEKFI